MDLSARFPEPDDSARAKGETAENRGAKGEIGAFGQDWSWGPYLARQS